MNINHSPAFTGYIQKLGQPEVKTDHATDKQMIHSLTGMLMSQKYEVTELPDSNIDKGCCVLEIDQDSANTIVLTVHNKQFDENRESSKTSESPKLGLSLNIVDDDGSYRIDTDKSKVLQKNVVGLLTGTMVAALKALDLPVVEGELIDMLERFTK